MFTNFKSEEDYAYIFEQIAKRLDIQPEECLFAAVSDQEKAQLKALKLSRLFDDEFTALVVCEIHLRENCEKKMKKCHFSAEEISVWYETTMSCRRKP